MDTDLAALHAIIADVERGFNDNDAELLTRHFRPDGSAVNVMGVLIAGREALAEANRRGLAGPLKDERARYELRDVTFLRPDVAVAHKLARAVDAHGAFLDERDAMVALYVFVKDEGRWWIAARQNTLIA
jgi:uncharacterized protein (TIGR02246 family)